MSSFFKAWVVYSGILVKLTPFPLQGDLATAIFIYTTNLYDLLEEYAGEGVKAYHFQFQRKRVGSGKDMYQSNEWRLLDSEQIASKCFAHPAPRGPWTQNKKPVLAPTRRVNDFPIYENISGQPYHAPSITTRPITHLTFPNSTRDSHPKTPSHASIGTIVCAKLCHAAITIHVFPVVATPAQHIVHQGIEVPSPPLTMGVIDVSSPSLSLFLVTCCLLFISYILTESIITSIALSSLLLK